MRQKEGEGQNARQGDVATPAWLQPRMMRNLRLAAHSRLQKRAAKAREILAAIERNGTTPTAKPAERLVALRDGGTSTKAGEQSTTSEVTGNNQRRSSKRKAWVAGLGHTAKTLVRRVSQWWPGRRATPLGQGRELWDSK